MGRGAEATSPAIVFVDSALHPMGKACGHHGACASIRFEVEDWPRTLTPWEAPGLRHEDPPFAGEGAHTLDVLTDKLLPDFLAGCGLSPSSFGICGYSLAGRFALFVTTRTDLFLSAASCSGSMWYDGWLDYLEATPSRARSCFFSVGTKEKRAQNPRLKTVERCHEECVRILYDQGIACTLEKVPGGHLDKVDARIARGGDVLADLLMLP